MDEPDEGLFSFEQGDNAEGFSGSVIECGSRNWLPVLVLSETPLPLTSFGLLWYSGPFVIKFLFWRH
jgi:hypothetical protein